MGSKYVLKLFLNYLNITKLPITEKLLQLEK
jgi:hypothetical protein